MLKPLIWTGSTLENLRACPLSVRQSVGYALELAQKGEKHENAKPLKGFKGGSVLEIVSDYDGDTWRTVYTVKIKAALYVLHVFQKKSKAGIATPRREIELIQKRLAAAVAHAKDQTT
jgi:phage-related protein